MSSRPLPLLVAGFHRSGTSLTMHSLARAGLHLGDDLVKAGPSNPDGHFESRPIVRFHDRLLEARGGSWFRVPEELGRFSSAERAEAVALADALRDGAPTHWGFKDPRLCLFLPLWNDVLERPRKVIIYRDPIGCLSSLLEREAQALACQPVHHASRLPLWTRPADALELWCRYNERLLAEVRACPERALVLSFTALLGDLRPSDELERRFGIALPQRAPRVVRGGAATASRTVRSRLSTKLLGRDRLRRAWALLDTFDTLCEAAPERRSHVPDYRRQSRSGPAGTDGRNGLADADRGAAVTGTEGGSIRLLLGALGVPSAASAAPGSLAVPTARAPTADSAAEPDRRSQATSAAIERARELARRSDADARNASLALETARAWLSAGERDAARTAFERSHVNGPHGHVASLHLGLMARDEGEHEAALGHFRAALRRLPGHLGLHAHAARALRSLGRDEEALSLARAGLERDPGHERLVEIAVAIALRLGRGDLASAWLDAATVLHPASARLAMLRYEVAVQGGELAEREAQPLLRRALALRLRGIDGAADALCGAIDALPEAEARVALSEAVGRELALMRDALLAGERPCGRAA